MKKRCVQSVLLVLATAVLGCDKGETLTEEVSTISSVNVTAVNEYAWPLRTVVGEPGIDATGSLNYPKDPRLEFPDGPREDPPRLPFKSINQPTANYIKETCLFDISQLEDHKTYTKIQNGSLRIGFFDTDQYSAFDPYPVLKLKSSSPTGWNSHWGFKPDVENEHPDVLYFEIWNFGFKYIYLSKPCIEFGFELAPNHKNEEHEFGVYFGNWMDDITNGYAGPVVKSPSGARLFAIKATKPFRMITIFNADNPKSSQQSGGFAIANIRYKLAE